jgi:hypothetical protein
MLKRIARVWIGAAWFVLLLQPGLLAQLKFTLHTELKRIQGAPANDWSALVAQLGGRVVPPGGVDHVVSVNDKAMRMEQMHDFAGMTAGTVTLFRDGQQFGMDPPRKTFWKTRVFSEAELKEIAAGQPDVKVTRTGEFETIDGMRAQRVTTVIVLKMPGEAMGSNIAGLPAEPALTFDAWVTDAVALPAGFVPLVDRSLLAELGIAQVNNFTDNKFLLRAVARLNLVPDFEIVMTVRDLSKDPVPGSLFEIPAGFREIAPPVNRGGLAGRGSSPAWPAALKGRPTF